MEVEAVEMVEPVLPPEESLPESTENETVEVGADVMEAMANLLDLLEIKVVEEPGRDGEELETPRRRKMKKIIPPKLIIRKRGRPSLRESKVDKTEKVTDQIGDKLSTTGIKREEGTDDDDNDDKKEISRPKVKKIVPLTTVVRKRGRPCRRESKVSDEETVDEEELSKIDKKLSTTVIKKERTDDDDEDRVESPLPIRKKFIMRRKPMVVRKSRPIRRVSKEDDESDDDDNMLSTSDIKLEIESNEDEDDDSPKRKVSPRRPLILRKGRKIRRQSKQDDAENEIDTEQPDEIKIEDDDDDNDNRPKTKKIIQRKPIILKRGRPVRRQSKRIRKPIGGNKDSLDISAEIGEDDPNPYAAAFQKPELLQVSKEFHNGTVFRIGDIISMTGEDGKIYYAQLKYFLSNQFCEKFVTIRWLLPNSRLWSSSDNSDKGSEKFNPDLFCQGPDQLEPINMDDIQFVMHLPEIYVSEKDVQFHQEEHGLTHVSLPTMGQGQGHRTQFQLSTKTFTSV